MMESEMTSFTLWARAWLFLIPTPFGQYNGPDALAFSFRSSFHLTTRLLNMSSLSSSIKQTKNEIQELIENAMVKVSKFLSIAQCTTGEKRKNAGYELYVLTVCIYMVFSASFHLNICII